MLQIEIYDAANKVRTLLSDEPATSLKLAMPLRIDQPVDPLRRGPSQNSHRHRFAGRRRQAVLGRLALHMRAVGVGHDEPGYRPERSRTANPA